MDRRIDVRLRKPRSTKGTPLFIERNYWAAGVVAISGLIWAAWEFSPISKTTKDWFEKHTQDSEEFKDRVAFNQAAWFNPTLHKLADKIKQKQAYENEPPTESRFFKFLQLLQQNPTGVDIYKDE